MLPLTKLMLLQLQVNSTTTIMLNTMLTKGTTTNTMGSSQGRPQLTLPITSSITGPMLSSRSLPLRVSLERPRLRVSQDWALQVMVPLVMLQMLRSQTSELIEDS